MLGGVLFGGGGCSYSGAWGALRGNLQGPTLLRGLLEWSLIASTSRRLADSGEGLGDYHNYR